MPAARGIFRAVLFAAVVFMPLSVPAQEAGPGEIRGRVLDEQGRPLADGRIECRRQGVLAVPEIRTGKDGRFHQGALKLGRYDLTVRRGEEVLWHLPITLSAVRPVVRVEIDIQKLREASAALERLTAELREQRAEESQRSQLAHSLRARHTRGVRMLREGQHSEAVTEFESILESDPERAVTQAMLASAFAASQRSAEAMVAYERLIALQPKEAAHHNNLAILLIQAGRMGEALPHLERARRLDKSKSGTFEFNLGAALYNAARYKESGKHFRAALRRDPTMAAAHYFYGTALLRQGPGGRDRKRAVSALRRYLQLEPEGTYAEAAQEQLQKLGARTTDMLLPNVRDSGVLE